MAKKIITYAIILALIFGAGYYTAVQLKPDNGTEQMGPVYASKAVEKGDIKVGVDITGSLQANYGGQISAPSVEGLDTPIKYTIEEYFVKENDTFKKGDTIVKLKSTNLNELIEKEIEKIDDYRKKIVDHNEKITEYKEESASIISKLEEKLSIKISNINNINTEDGMIINAPIDGRIKSLEVTQGDKIVKNEIASIVNDAKVKIKFQTTISEYANLSVGDDVLLSYLTKNADGSLISKFDGTYSGKIIELDDTKISDANGTGFIHVGVIEAENPGLVVPGLSVQINTVYNEKPLVSLRYVGEVESYLDESKIYTNYVSTNTSPFFANEVYVNKNDFVKAGDPIVRIAGKGLDLEVAEQVKQVKSLQTSIKTEQDSIADVNKEINNTQEKIAKLNSLKDKLTVKAEKDGIVSWMRYQVGDTLEVTAGSDSWSTSLCEVYNANDMTINTKVSDLDVIYIKEGSEVDVTVDALPNSHFEGLVDRLYTYQGGQDGKIQYSVNISVTGGDGLRPGMNTNCFVDAGESLDTLIVPIEAVFEENYKQKVEVLNDDNTTTVVEIETGLMNDRYVEVLSGLEEGQKVVTGSVQDLLPSEKSDDNSGSIFPNN